MVIWSHVAASVWLPLAMPVPHQDPVPCSIRLTMGASQWQSCRDDPHPMILLLGSCCTSFQPIFHSWGNGANPWMEYMEGGREAVHRGPLCASHAAQLLFREALVMFFTPSVSKQFQFPPPQLSFPEIWSIWTIRYILNWGGQVHP